MVARWRLSIFGVRICTVLVSQTNRVSTFIDCTPREGLAVEPTVHIRSKPHVVSVHQQSKTVWIAVGYYTGKRIEVKGRTQLDAVAGWRKKAVRYKGN